MINLDIYNNEEYYKDINIHEQKISTKNYLRIFRLLKLKPKSLLDVGCGSGIFVKTLREKGVEAIGIDFSNYAGKQIPDWFIQHDATKPFPFKDKSFDIVFSSSSTTTTALPDIDLIDFYSESNFSSQDGLSSAYSTGHAQSFTCGFNCNLDSAKFYFSKGGSPTGNAYAKVYAHSGTYGTSSVPTGAALATSDAVDVSGLSAALNLKTFNFSGANRISLSASTSPTEYSIVKT